MSIVHKNKIESNKKLIFKKNFRFTKFPLFNPLASFDLNLLEKGWTKYFKNGLKSFHISQALICTVYLFWVRTLIQMSSPDSSGLYMTIHIFFMCSHILANTFERKFLAFCLNISPICNTQVDSVYIMFFLVTCPIMTHISPRIEN